MRFLIVLAVVAAILIAGVIVVPIEVSPFVPATRSVSLRRVAERIDVRLIALAAHSQLRAPPA